VVGGRADLRREPEFALVLAGQKAEAQQELKQVQGDASLVALASLWADFAARRTGSAN
jgi:hypothetical protein